MDKTRAARLANTARRKVAKQVRALNKGAALRPQAVPALPSSVRSIRIADHLWAEIERIAVENGFTTNKVAVEFLAEMTGVTLLSLRKPRCRSQA